MTWSKKYRKVNVSAGNNRALALSALQYDERTNSYEWHLKLVPATLSEREKAVFERQRLSLEKAALIKAMVVKRFKNIEIAAALSKMYGRGYGVRTVAKYAALLRQNMH